MARGCSHRHQLAQPFSQPARTLPCLLVSARPCPCLSLSRPARRGLCRPARSPALPSPGQRGAGGRAGAAVPAPPCRWQRRAAAVRAACSPAFFRLSGGARFYLATRVYIIKWFFFAEFRTLFIDRREGRRGEGTKLLSAGSAAPAGPGALRGRRRAACPRLPVLSPEKDGGLCGAWATIFPRCGDPGGGASGFTQATLWLLHFWPAKEPVGHWLAPPQLPSYTKPVFFCSLSAFRIRCACNFTKWQLAGGWDTAMRDLCGTRESHCCHWLLSLLP